MKLFTVGPVNPYQETNQVYKNLFPYFRTEDYGILVQNNLKSLATLLGIEYKNNIIYLTASGTAAMEASIENCFTCQDKLLIINGGSFGHRFCDICAWHNIPFDSVDLPYNEMLTENHLKPYETKSYTALLVNLHETSTGQLYDIKLLSEFCQRKNMLLVVDAISTFLADPYNMTMNHIDLTIFSSQKGLSLSPGLSFVAISKRMLERIYNMPSASTMYFNFKDYLKNIERGQTPYTPAIGIMYELEQILILIKQVGLDNWLNKIKDKCFYFRNRANELGLTIPNSYPLSNMLTPIMFKDVDAYDIFTELKNKYSIFVNPCGGELATRMFRVSHIGNTRIEDFDDLAIKIKKTYEELKGMSHD